jgi:hypothetical protein
VLVVPSAEMGWVAQRPARSVLGSRRGILMPRLEDALGCYLDTYRADPPSGVLTGSFLTRQRAPA